MLQVMVSALGKEIILGTAQLGTVYGIKNKVSNSCLMGQDQALILLNASLKNKITSFDTARDYGTAEEILGHWPMRENVKIFSKIKGATSLSHAENLFAQCLEALQMKSIHCLSLHLFEECLKDFNLELLEKLKKSGLIEKTGISIYKNEEIKHVLAHTDLEVIQSPFNLLDHWGERGSVFIELKKAGKTLHIRSVFLQGLLLMSADEIAPHLKSIKPTIKYLSALAIDSGCSIRDLCLAYVLNCPAIDGVILGVDGIQNLEENLATIRTIDQIKVNRAEIEKVQVIDSRILNPSLWSQI